MKLSKRKMVNKTEQLKKLLIRKDNEISQLKNIIDDLPSDVYWKDKHGVYLGVNAMGCENLRNMGFILKESDIIGKSDYDIYDKNTADNFRKNDLDIMLSKTIQTKEESATLPSGKKLTQLSIKRPLFNKEGEVIGIVGNTIDITDRKLAEESEKNAILELSQSKEKAQAEEHLRQAVMILSGSIAHDLRTPISILEMNGDTLKDSQLMLNDGNHIPLQLREQLSLIGDTIINTTRQMHNFIDITLKTLGKVTSGDLREEDLVTCSMWHCIHNTLKRYPFTKEQRKLITWDQGDFKFKGNELLMIRILFNLIANSLEQIKKNNFGEIFISTEIKDDVNIIYFKDTAGGLPEDIKEKIFSSYYTTKEKGSGVGLAFCKITMEGFYGTINCQSVYGEYIIFKLTFPAIS